VEKGGLGLRGVKGRATGWSTERRKNPIPCALLIIDNRNKRTRRGAIIAPKGRSRHEKQAAGTEIGGKISTVRTGGDIHLRKNKGSGKHWKAGRQPKWYREAIQASRKKNK